MLPLLATLVIFITYVRGHPLFSAFTQEYKGYARGKGLNHMYTYKMVNNYHVYTVHSINIYTVCFVKEGGG